MKNWEDMPVIMTTKQLAEVLMVSPDTIIELVIQKVIPSFKLGGEYRFNRDRVRAWSEQEHAHPSFTNTEGGTTAKLPDKLERVRDKLKPPTEQNYGVYFLLDDGEVVYVGKSTNVQNRLKQHTDKSFTDVVVFEVGEKYLDRAEFAFIRLTSPTLNIRGQWPEVGMYYGMILRNIGYSETNLFAIEQPVLEILTPKQLAKLLQMDVTVLYDWRRSGTGPRFLKLGSKTIRYMMSDVKEWLETKKMTSTADE